MVRIPALFLRLSVIACAGAMLLLCARGALAQGAGSGGFTAAPSTTTSTAASGNTTPRVVQPAPDMQPVGASIQSGVGAQSSASPSQPATLYDAQSGPTAPVYGGAPGAAVSPYGQQPTLYGVQADPGVQAQGYYSAQVGPIQGAPQYAPQYAAPPQYAQPMPQYAAPAQYAPQPQYVAPAQPQYAQPQYAPQPGPAPYSPGSQYGIPQRLQTAAQAASPPGAGGYTLGPGDKVRVTVYDETDLSGEFTVDGNGTIRLPLIGTLRAQGDTQQMLEAAIHNALSPNYIRNPRVNVEILAYRPIYVVGAVAHPGQFAYLNDMTMLNAVALAGGFTDQAVDSTVYVRHEGQTDEEAVSTAMPLLIRPGDTVRVKTTIFWQALNMFSPLTGPVAVAAAATH